MRCEKKRRVKKIKQKNGKVKAVVVYDYMIRYDTNEKRGLYLDSSLYPRFNSHAEGKEWILANAEMLAGLTNRSDILKSIAWKNEYHDFKELFELFEKKQKVHAKNVDLHHLARASFAPYCHKS